MPEPIVIASIKAFERPLLISRLAGFAKSCSIVWLQSLGIPVLDGLIVDSWESLTEIHIKEFSKSNNTGVLLLRIDKKGKRWTERRGGYFVQVDRAAELWEELANEAFIPILLEPASPYSNQCALSGVLSLSDKNLIIEAVGLGFDASDILRSDLQAHERWQISLSESSWPLHFVDAPRRTFLISQSEYCISRKERLIKIGLRVRNPAFPRKAVGEVSDDQLVDEARTYLQTIRHPALLQANDYNPLPLQIIQQFADEVLKLKNALKQNAPGIGSISVAATVLADSRMVFWDFFPVNPHEAPLLWQ